MCQYFHNLILSNPHNAYIQAVVPMDRQGVSGSKSKELSKSQPGLPDCRGLITAAPQISIRCLRILLQGMRNSLQRGPGPWGDAHLASDGHPQISPGEVQAMLIHPSLTPGRSLLPWDIPASNSTFLFPSRPLLTGQRQPQQGWLPLYTSLDQEGWRNTSKLVGEMPSPGAEAALAQPLQLSVYPLPTLPS